MAQRGSLELLVSCSPDVMSGKPVFRGTRVPVKNLLDYLAVGHSLDDGEPLAEGATVTVLAPDEDSFELGPEGETLLLASIREAEQGRVVEGASLLRDLDGRS